MKAVLALALVTAPTVVSAQPAMEVPSAVSAFNAACLAGGLDPTARPAALARLGWSKGAVVTVDVPSLGISAAIDRNYDFSKPESAEQWSRMIDGRPAKVILATFPAKRRYPNLCALVVDGVSNAMPYGDDLKMAFKAFGIDRKSVDLVHYYEFSGKVGTEKHPVRGEIFTRSRASGDAKSMHIYVAY